VQGSRTVRHAHEVLLAACQPVKPGRGEAIVWIELKDQHVLAIVAEHGVTIARTPIGAAAVPALTVEDDDTARRRPGLNDVFRVEPVRRLDESALVRAWNNSGTAILGREVIEHPHRVHHDRGCHVQHQLRNVAMQPLFSVPGTNDTGVETSQDEIAAKKMLEQRQHPRVVDGGVKDPIEGRQVADVARRPPVRALRSAFSLAANQGIAHRRGFMAIEDALEQGESVNLDFRDRLFELRHLVNVARGSKCVTRLPIDGDLRNTSFTRGHLAVVVTAIWAAYLLP
jgi:hypothetical protein